MTVFSCVWLMPARRRENSWCVGVMRASQVTPLQRMSVKLAHGDLTLPAQLRAIVVSREAAETVPVVSPPPPWHPSKSQHDARRTV
jgi:hypothetical protein